MLNKGSVDWFWRLIATAILYFFFGVGALIVGFVLIPAVALTAWDKTTRVSRVRFVNRVSFRCFVECGIWIGVFAVNVHQKSQLSKVEGELIIANHPSLLDVVFLLAFIPNANCVVKHALLRNPFLAMQVYFADYILNDDGTDVLKACQMSMERRESIIIFPEGTRTVEEEGIRFKRGAAYLMLVLPCLVRPVYISCKPPALGKHDPWYRIPERKIQYDITILEAINIQPIRESEQLGMPLKTRRLTRYLVNLYQRLNESAIGESIEYVDLAEAVRT